ncbi:MAG: cytochrome b6-f complex iron-sulfur subunit [Actinomycetota bacterium]|jgi:cytochrome b6-f complex iron-sulfur subunit|nr:cytochrome b6-f complex iron-sulfur subunit [Actinomycetota bacterium]
MNAIAIIAIAAVVVLAGVFMFTTLSRRDRASLPGLSRETRKRDRSQAAIETLEEEHADVVSGREVERSVALERSGGGTLVIAAPPAPPAPRMPLDDEALGVTRRQFFNRAALTLTLASLATFGASLLAFLWPSLSGGFGTKIRVGKLSDIATTWAKGEPFYVPEGRFYLNPYPKDGVSKAKSIGAYAAVIPGYEAGVVALYQKCVHLGCRVPWCPSSQWFECPCHGSKYNRVGEKKEGPAPRGLDRFPVTVSGGIVTVDSGARVLGPPIGTNTTGQEQEGPHCR